MSLLIKLLPIKSTNSINAHLNFFSKGSYLEEMDKFYSLCKTTLYADFIILLESKDPLSIKIVESQPKFNFSIDQTNINLLSISYSENRPVLPYTLTRQEINFSNFDALEEIDFAQMIAVPIPNENIEDRRKIFFYSYIQKIQNTYLNF